jgi:hypothetical protein
MERLLPVLELHGLVMGISDDRIKEIERRLDHRAVFGIGAHRLEHEIALRDCMIVGGKRTQARAPVVVFPFPSNGIEISLRIPRHRREGHEPDVERRLGPLIVRCVVLAIGDLPVCGRGQDAHDGIALYGVAERSRSRRRCGRAARQQNCQQHPHDFTASRSVLAMLVRFISSASPTRL